MSVNEGVVSGVISHTFASDKFVSVKIEIPPSGGSRYPDRITLVGFSSVVNAAKKLGQGEEVTVRYRLGSKKLTDKAGTPVQCDGYNVWVPQLVITDIRLASTGKPEGNDVPPPF